MVVRTRRSETLRPRSRQPSAGQRSRDHHAGGHLTLGASSVGSCTPPFFCFSRFDLNIHSGGFVDYRHGRAEQRGAIPPLTGSDASGAPEVITAAATAPSASRPAAHGVKTRRYSGPVADLSIRNGEGCCQRARKSEGERGRGREREGGREEEEEEEGALRGVLFFWSAGDRRPRRRCTDVRGE